MNEIFSALSKAQAEFKTVLKTSDNPFFKSKYADLATIWESLRPILSKYGLCVIQTTQIKDNNMMSLVTTLGHISGQNLQGEYLLQPIKNDPQSVGSAITYARRYALSAILGIVSDIDDDGEAAMARTQVDKLKSVTQAALK